MGLFGGGNKTTTNTTTTELDVDVQVNPYNTVNIDTAAIGNTLQDTFGVTIDRGGKVLKEALLDSTSNLAFAILGIGGLIGLAMVLKR